MVNEHIRKDALIKLYVSRQQLEDYENEEKYMLCQGKISQILSDSEIEVVSEPGVAEGLQKNICYVMYLFLSQEVYMCNCYYKSAYTEENCVLTLELVSPFEKVQRRMHQRVSCHSRIRYRQIPKEEALQIEESARILQILEEEGESYEDSLVDISGGGIRFTSREPIPESSYLIASFELTNEKRKAEMQVIGQVVFSMPLRNEQNCFDIRMKYIGLTEEERAQIIRFVFQLERDSLNVRWQRGGGFA